MQLNCLLVFDHDTLMHPFINESINFELQWCLHFNSTWSKHNYKPLIDISKKICGDTFLFPTCNGVNEDIYFWAP